MSRCPECDRLFLSGADDNSAIVDAQGENWKSCRENAHWKLRFHFNAEHADKGMRCPRRNESVRGMDEGVDWWEKRTPGAGRQCSYCGSLHPDDLFAAIESGCKLGPTDKNYKLYVDLPEPNPDELRVSSASTGIDCPGEGWVPADPERMKKDGWNSEYRWMCLSPRGPTIHGKFYFQHLSADEQQRFIDLYNAKKMNIGYPGHFYRLPFFMRLAPPKEQTH